MFKYWHQLPRNCFQLYSNCPMGTQVATTVVRFTSDNSAVGNKGCYCGRLHWPPRFECPVCVELVVWLPVTPWSAKELWLVLPVVECVSLIPFRHQTCCWCTYSGAYPSTLCTTGSCLRLLRPLWQRTFKSTRLVYQSGWRKYVTFCTRFHLRPLLVTSYNWCLYVTDSLWENSMHIPICCKILPD